MADPPSRPTSKEVLHSLNDIEAAVQDCWVAVKEDSGCIDPDRTLTPFEDLQAETTRLFVALGLADQQQHSTEEGEPAERIAAVAEQLKLAEIADRINSHLKRLEVDEDWNYYVWTDSQGGRHMQSRLYSARAGRAGRYVGVTYVSYQGQSSLTKAEALAYLEWLDAGNKGRHLDQQREAEGGESR